MYWDCSGDMVQARFGRCQWKDRLFIPLIFSWITSREYQFQNSMKKIALIWNRLLAKHVHRRLGSSTPGSLGSTRPNHTKNLTLILVHFFLRSSSVADSLKPLFIDSVSLSFQSSLRTWETDHTDWSRQVCSNSRKKEKELHATPLEKTLLFISQWFSDMKIESERQGLRPQKERKLLVELLLRPSSYRVCRAIGRSLSQGLRPFFSLNFLVETRRISVNKRMTINRPW